MGPLVGVRVVEVAALGPVPLAGMLLADMGADVVVIDRENAPWQIPGDIQLRGKQRTVLNLKNPNERDQAKSLIDCADVLIEGFRPGVMERLGLGPDVFVESNPKLIYGRMTGWGQTGPLAGKAGHDINYIGLTGALNAIGSRDSVPPPPLNLLGDYGGGTMFLLMGVLAALHEAQGSGLGQVVDAAITEGTSNLMTLIYSMANIDQWKTQRQSNLLDSAAPYYRTYATKDEKYISLGALEPEFYQELTSVLRLDERLFKEQNNPSLWAEQHAVLSELFKTQTRAEWEAQFAEHDACFAPVLDFEEAPEHPQLKARNAFLHVDDSIQPAPTPRFSRTQGEAGCVETEVTPCTEIIERWAKA